MNREIKFRAWDKGKKVFIPTDVWGICQTDFNAFGIMIKDWENYKEGEYFYSNLIDISQYTGLKDMNGVEIFEGDLVKHPTWDYPFEVVFDKENARFVCKRKSGLTLYITNDELVVVGNIYEN